MRCDVVQIVSPTPAQLDPMAEERWRRFDTQPRAGAAYCPVLDVAGGRRTCLDIGCGFGERLDWTLSTASMTDELGLSNMMQVDAEILVDGELAGRMTFERATGTADIFRAPFKSSLHRLTLTQLQSGQQAELRLASAGQSRALMMPLRGSSRALDGILQMCGDRLMNASPANTRDRFASAIGPSQPEAMAIARETLANDLAQMRQATDDSDIGVEYAGLIDAGEGWRFLITEVGPSSQLFGAAYFGIMVFAAPPGEKWRRVGPDASAGIFWVDLEQRNQGWPRLVYQSSRGGNPPFHIWRWDGASYVHDREIP
jgi:hypothetical protein